jgi:hypothetical protein
MCLICGVSMNWTLSNLYRQAANFSHYMKRGKDIEKERANSFLAAYRAGLPGSGHLGVRDIEVKAYAARRVSQ